MIALASQPTASVAAVALANGLNANMLRRWVREAGVPTGRQVVAPTGNASTMLGFVQLPMAHEQPGAAAPSSPPPIDTPQTVFVEFHRGATSVYVSLPLDRASAAWLREVLA